jgi:alpha-D-xyloside xylohydrolase
MKPQMKTDGWFLQVVTLPRAGWIGTWKWGASLWTGDIGSTLPILADAVKTILSAQATGFAWMTIDGGGYCGGDSQSPAYRETQLRWMQLSATLPIMRQHGAEDAFFEPFLF